MPTTGNFGSKRHRWLTHGLLAARLSGQKTMRCVIVDTREFRSSLPNLLYRVGIQVVPCMLTVGDYVLSPKLCVERKAIPDLISSFKSGRLYQQCVSKCFVITNHQCYLLSSTRINRFLEPFAEFKPPTSRATNPLSAKIPETRDPAENYRVACFISSP